MEIGKKEMECELEWHFSATVGIVLITSLCFRSCMG